MSIDIPAEPPRTDIIMPGLREVWSFPNGMARQVFGPILLNVHSYTTCDHPCPLHRPGQHIMRAWPLSYRADRQFFERLCEHGIGHPDPDSAQYFWRRSRENIRTHGCDGCCSGLGSSREV